MLLTPHICHPGPVGPGRNSTALSTARAVADCSLHCTSAIQDLQVLEGAQQRSAALELWQIAPFTAQLPSRSCRSWQELNSAQRCWSCGRLFLTPQICHPGPAGPGRSSAALALWQIVPYTAHLPSKTCRSWKELSSARQPWSCGRLLLTPHICHPGPAGLGKSSTALSTAGAVADCSLHHRSAIQDLQVLTGDQKCSAMLELWQSLPHTTNLPSRTCRSWMELSSAQQC